MIILYFFECMIIVLLSFHGGTNSTPMKTTGELPTWGDRGVGFIGYVVIVAIICFLKYKISKKRKMPNDKNAVINEKTDATDFKDANKIDRALKENNRSMRFIKFVLYLLECVFLLLLSAAGGTNGKMITIGKKPGRKEVVICLTSWIVIATIIILLITL